MGKGQNEAYQHFLLFQKNFQKASFRPFQKAFYQCFLVPRIFFRSHWLLPYITIREMMISNKSCCIYLHLSLVRCWLNLNQQPSVLKSCTVLIVSGSGSSANFRLFKFSSKWRYDVKNMDKWDTIIWLSRKHCGKRRNCALQGFCKIWPSNLVFDPTWPTSECVRDFIKTNILTRFHDYLSEMWPQKHIQGFSNIWSSDLVFDPTWLISNLIPNFHQG